jgi:hypothetical protein
VKPKSAAPRPRSREHDPAAFAAENIKKTAKSDQDAVRFGPGVNVNLARPLVRRVAQQTAASPALHRRARSA